MSYSIETYDKAQSILDRRKERATLEAQDRADEAFVQKSPNLTRLTESLRKSDLTFQKHFLQVKIQKRILTGCEQKALHFKRKRKIF